MAEIPNAPEVARRLADALEAADIPYAIGGALAYGLHAPPRATNDVDLTLFKLLFFRSKDLSDEERLVAFQGAALDRAYIRRWLLDMVGEDDVRLSTWDRIADT